MNSIQVSDGDAPMGFGLVGLFPSLAAAQAWHAAAMKAGIKHPFFLNVQGEHHVLFWKKAKNAKKKGKGVAQ